MSFTERQIEIIRAAAALIGEKGIQNLTTKALAERMNFSEPALYRHFRDKTDILSSVLDFYREQLKKAIADIAAQPVSGLEKLEKIVHFQFDHFTQNPAVVMVIFAETSFQYDRRLSVAVKNILFSKKEGVERIIAMGQQDGSIRRDMNTDQIATVYMGSMRFTILQWRLEEHSWDLRRQGHVLWSTLQRIITPCEKS